jgi:hypothetical protein
LPARESPAHEVPVRQVRAADAFTEQFEQRPGVCDATVDVVFEVCQCVRGAETGCAQLLSTEITDT